MSHPLYNSYPSGNQSSTQGQYGLPRIQADRDPRMASRLRPGSSFSSSGGSSATPANSGGMLSASLGHRQLDVESGSSSMDWSSKFDSSSALSNSASGGNSRFNAYTYTSESATNILLHFGLEKEDLEHLISFPEDQITPDNLPLILHQIRIQKAKKTTIAVQSKPYPEPQPSRSMSGMDSHSLSSPGGAGMHQEQMSSAYLQPSKVIGGVGEEIGKTIGSRANSGGSRSILLMDTYDSSSHSQEPLQKNMMEVKSSALDPSRDQASPVTSLSSSYSSVLSSVAPPSNDPTKRLETQPNQTSQTILSSFSLTKKDTDIRVLKSEASKSVTLKEPEADRQSPVIGSNDASGTKNQSIIQGQGSMVAEQMKKQQPMQQTQQQQKQQTHEQTQKQPMQQTHEQPVSQMGQVSNGLQMPTTMHDYAADSNKECTHMKDWISHQNASLHLENCKLFRKQARSHSPRYDRPSFSCYRSSSRSPERRSGKRRPLPRRSRERRSSTEVSSPQRKKSRHREMLNGAVQSLSEQSDLDAVVKTLAPALLAELLKMMAASSSSSSSSSKEGKQSALQALVKALVPALQDELVKMNAVSSSSSSSSSSPPSVGRKRLSSAASSSSSSSADKELTSKPSKAKPSLQKSEANSSTKMKTSTRRGDRPDHGSPHTSSTSWMEEDFPQLCSTTPTSTDGNQRGRKQPANTGDAVPVPEISRLGRQENLAPPGPEDGCSEPKELLPNFSESAPPPAQQGPVEGFKQRLQLYSVNHEKFSYTQLSNPRAWQHIAYARPGWIPDHLPYLQLDIQYWKLKAKSTVVSTRPPPHGQRPKRVACVVTCYNHFKGPWCEVQSMNGTIICILAATPQCTPPPTTRIQPLMWH